MRRPRATAARPRATAARAGAKAAPLRAIATRFEDWLNPIVVKEMRQAVQAKYVTGVLLLFTLGLLVVMGGMVLSDLRYGFSSELGLRVFIVLYGILLGTCMVLVPAYCAGRLMIERSASRTDLFFITTLRPRSIIWGKFASGLVLVVLIYSASAPFLTFTYLLRGIDMSAIFVLLLVGLVGGAGAVAVALFVACIPTSRLVKGFLALVGLGIVVGGYLLILVPTVAALEWEGSAWVTSAYALAMLVPTAVLVAEGIGFLLVAAVAIISPASANRALPLRLYVTIVWLLTAVGAYIWAASVGHRNPVAIWVVLSVGAFCIGLLAAVSERSKLGPRVARRIPRFLPLRPLAFLFYSGSAGGVAWCILGIGLTLGAGAVFNAAAPFTHPYGYDDLSGPLAAMLGLSLYVIAYATTGFILHKAFFRTMSAGYTWMLAICVGAAACVFPIIGHLVARDPYAYGAVSELWGLGTPILAFDVDHAGTARLFAGVWAGVSLLIASLWLVPQAVRFRRYESEAPHAPEPAGGPTGELQPSAQIEAAAPGS